MTSLKKINISCDSDESIKNYIRNQNVSFMRAETLFLRSSVPSTWNVGRNSEHVGEGPKERNEERRKMSDCSLQMERNLKNWWWEILKTSVFLLVTNCATLGKSPTLSGLVVGL